MACSWEPPPLHRHLSTIGIGPVFVCPPPHPLPSHPIDSEASAEDDAQHHDHASSGDPSSPSQQKQETLATWEIIGDIKSTPEDFIVREIGWAPPASGLVEASESDAKYNINKYSRKPGWSRKIAGLECGSKSTVDEGIKSQGPSYDTIDTKSDNGEGLSNRGENGAAGDQMPTTPETKKAKTVDTNSDGPLASGGVETPLPPKLPTISVSPQPSTQSSDVPPSKSQNIKTLKNHVDPNPTEGLWRILAQCHQQSSQETSESMEGSDTSQKEEETAAEDILNQLTNLQKLALEQIGQQHSATSDTNKGGSTVWIATAGLALNVDSREDWKLLHSYIRHEFPFLQTETSSVGPNADDSNETKEDDEAKNNGKSGCVKNTWVCAFIDRNFFPLAPHLSNPREDLLSFYKFRNDGPTPASSKGGDCRSSSAPRQNKWKRNKRNPQKEPALPKEEKPDGNEDDASSKTTKSSTQGRLLLRLRPDLPRSERRGIHQMLSSSRRREFETSTEKDVPLDYADRKSERTTAIVVLWSRNSIQASQKRKRAVGDGSSQSSSSGNKKPQSNKSSNITAIFCILRKQQVEHQVAVQNVTRALRCRAGDIGLAGIKDMQAVTYQFCTLRNVDLKRAQRANDSLGSKIQLSSFVDEVQDFLLDRGRLLGNRFEITVRNLKRVQRMYVEGEESQTSSWKEQAVPVHASHLDAMVKRMGKGFINYYGEQRVGNAGSRSYVGVRAFDVGQAMLQRNFAKAIDLIMTGRSNQVYNPGDEEIKAREVWKESGGDARATLKAFPKSRNTLVRERDMMKGLLRYGDALEAVRCVSHSMRMFWIHAYQSYVWNRVATERVKRWGIRPVVGDLFIKELESGSDDKDDTTGNVQVVRDPSSVDISQIVLPLPGYNVQYPSNEIGEMYSQILKDDKVDLSVKDSIPEATAKGSYRKLIQPAGQLKWDIVPDNGEKASESTEDPVVNAAQFSFELESGCYATMMLRELMVSTMSRDSKRVNKE